MKKLIKKAFIATLPVLTGYLVLGFGFGIILRSTGFSVLMAFAMSLFIYAGSMQYVAIDLFTGGASYLTVALTTLMVNARHLFYGISMLDKYRGTGAKKAYLMYTLTDETYSLVCGELSGVQETDRSLYYLLVSLMDHIYWVTGSVLGAIAGGVLPFSTEGIDFALTALFLTVFTEQWLSARDRRPALIGVAASALCLVIFGSESFLIPAMLVIALTLTVIKEAKP
ncbi:MAG: AzlC family ABC transporter permease [Clostridia bacterium]|nr:AzlC family ABC transporter permease [Clostridia bacterium]